jgi:hypothetical protein
MFGHQHKTDQLNIGFLTRGIDASTQPLTPVVICQKRQSTITGKGQFVKMAGLVKMPNLLPMLSRLGHDRNYIDSGQRREFSMTYRNNGRRQTGIANRFTW